MVFIIVGSCSPSRLVATSTVQVPASALSFAGLVEVLKQVANLCGVIRGCISSKKAALPRLYFNSYYGKDG